MHTARLAATAAERSFARPALGNKKLFPVEEDQLSPSRSSLSTTTTTTTSGAGLLGRGRDIIYFNANGAFDAPRL